MTQTLSLFERTLNLFTRVRAGEGRTVAVFALYAGLIIISYYIFKTLREPLVIASASADAKAYSTALAALVLLLFMPVYSSLFRAVSREKLVMILALAFAAMGLAFAACYQVGMNIGYVYYVWVSIYGVVMVAQFWVFANGSFNVKSGKRLFPIILMGASVGGLVGAQIASWVLSYSGVFSGLLVASLVIASTAALPYFARNSVPEESRCIDCHLYQPKASGLLGGISVVFNSKLLLLIAGYALILNIINSSGEYIFAQALLDHVDSLGIVDLHQRQNYIGQVYAQFSFWVTAIALALQLFVVSRIFIHFGMPVAILVMPVLMTIGYFLGGFLPVFSFIYLLKVTDNSLDYSITNTVRQTLFLPVTHEEKFEGKTAIDTLFWRLGDLFQAGLIYASIHWLGWGIAQLMMFCAVLGVIWIMFSRLISTEYQRRIVEHPGEAPKLNAPFDEIPVMPGRELLFRIPSNTFTAADPSDCLHLSAKQADGSALPSWLKLHAKEALLRGVAPHALSPLSLKLTASDDAGLCAHNHFVLQPIDPTTHY
ncbi:ATP translocase [Pseudomonas sp.]|uniref:ATP translocase n=1 Tax=Pseudomonas sp. TaxID=306 RepID=UPI00257CC5AD|nr:ATP translocase [Pseudomonas sp.]